MEVNLGNPSQILVYIVILLLLGIEVGVTLLGMRYHVGSKLFRIKHLNPWVVTILIFVLLFAPVVVAGGLQPKVGQYLLSLSGKTAAAEVESVRYYTYGSYSNRNSANVEVAYAADAQIGVIAVTYQAAGKMVHTKIAINASNTQEFNSLVRNGNSPKFTVRYLSWLPTTARPQSEFIARH